MQKLFNKKLLSKNRIALLFAVFFISFIGITLVSQPPTAFAADAATNFCKKYDGEAQKSCVTVYRTTQKDPHATIACSGGMRPNPVVKACDAGAKAGKKAGNAAASKAAKKAKDKESQAKKAVKAAEAAVKKACEKDKDSKACKEAKKKLADAKKAAAKAAADAKVAAKKAISAPPSTGGACKGKTFFGLVPWYAYIGQEFQTSNTTGVGHGGKCVLKCFNFLQQTKPNECGVKHSDIPYVFLAIVDDLLRVSGLVAVAFVIIGATKYITSQGNPEDSASAQATLINALIGLAVAIVAVGFVSFLGSRIT